MPADYDKGGKMRRIEGLAKDPTPMLKQIGAMMVAESQLAFREQKFGDTSWPPRRVPNLFGILSDLAAGKQIPKRRFDARPALRDSDDLMRRIADRMIGTHVVEVGSRLPYAALMNYGGESESVKLTDHVRKALWQWLKTKGKAHKKDLGWVLNKKFAGKSLKSKIPARPFVGITRQTIRDVQEVIGVSIKEA